MKFTVIKVSPSQNVTDRMHWAAKRKLKEDWHWLMYEQTQPYFEVFKLIDCDHKVFDHVKITRFGARKLDEGNLIGGLKVMVDNLIDLGLIEDDSPDKCTFEYHQETGKPYRTEFELSVRG